MEGTSLNHTLYRTVLGAIEQIDRNIISAARTLGVSEWKIFWRVIMPNIKGGILAGLVLSYTRAMGEFGATIMFAGNVPNKTQTLSIAIYAAAQANDFNRFGRTYKVMLQSDVFYRSEVESAKFVCVRSSTGKMIPLDTLITPKLNTGTMQISRFNSKRAISIQGRAATGYSSGEAMAALEEVVRTEAPEGFNIEWSGQSREEKNASGI